MDDQEKTARITALNYAAQACSTDTEAFAGDTVMVARQIYLFLNGKDPVIDAAPDLNEDFEFPSAEVVNFIEYVHNNGHNDDD